MTDEIVPSSFRDPSGFLFFHEGSIYRRVSQSYGEHYDCLMSSGLYDDLAGSGLLIPHDEVDSGSPLASGAYKVLKPQMVPFISYPYEWCFSQLKDAALATLAVQKKALDHGMTLKDASAFNIQFVKGKPVLIDTLSFEKYIEGYPWIAYRQFCQHFLAPLALMSIKDVRLGRLSAAHIDGVPLDLASELLPHRTRLSFGLSLHIHLHARSQKRYADVAVDKAKLTPKISLKGLLGLIDNLQSTITGLKWKPEGTEWGDYYRDDSYTPEAMEHKKALVSRYLDQAKPRTVWDLGGNTGLFSRIAAGKGAMTVSSDVDPACVELNYREVVEKGEENLLPLLIDLTNPSARIGWANDERMSFMDRGPVDTVMALALIHHLAISNNVPLDRVAGFLAGICGSLIIEFVPKSDAKVKKLLSTREDVFPRYTQEAFEEDFSRLFDIRASDKIEHSERMLYLMTRK